MIGGLHLILKLDSTGAGAYSGQMISLDQGNAAIPIDTVSLAADGALHLELKSIGASYDAKLNAAGDDAVQMWMMEHGLAPSMKNGEEAELRTEMFGMAAITRKVSDAAWNRMS